jgi:hypothetical protein
MTKTEAEYYSILKELKLVGEIIQIRFEAHTFKLAEGLRYTPDFEIVYADPSRGKAFFEIKGSEFFASGKSNQQNSITKLKMAAMLFPEYYWYKCYPRAKKDGGAWVTELISQ